MWKVLVLLVVLLWPAWSFAQMGNPYSRYGSWYSDYSWRNPYASRPPRVYSGGRYYGEWSVSPYRSDSMSNPYGRYGSPYSPGYGWYSPHYVYPGW